MSTPPFAAEVAACRAAQQSWSRLPVRDRLRPVRELRHLIVDRADDLLAAVKADVGRPPAEVLATDLLPTAAALKFLEREAARLLKPRRIPGRLRPTWLFGCRDTVHRRPWGVVGVIGTWNYPVFLNVVQVAQAVVAGNGVLWKPSEHSSKTAGVTADLFRAAGFPPDLLVTLPATREAGPLVAEAEVDHVVFTGSDAVGRKLAARLGERLVPSTLELSGCDAMFVLEDADIEMAAKAAWFGVTLNRGQTCIAVRRVFVQRSRYQAFADALGKLAAGAGPMELVTRGQADQMGRLVADAVGRGAVTLDPSHLSVPHPFPSPPPEGEGGTEEDQTPPPGGEGGQILPRSHAPRGNGSPDAPRRPGQGRGASDRRSHAERGNEGGGEQDDRLGSSTSPPAGEVAAGAQRTRRVGGTPVAAAPPPGSPSLADLPHRGGGEEGGRLGSSSPSPCGGGEGKGWGTDRGVGSLLVRPAVFLDLPPDAALCREAAFAPVCAVIPFDTIDDAVSLAAVSPFGLAASVFTADPAAAEALAARVPAGHVAVNDVLAPTAHPATPFGGRGASGWGVTQGAEGLLAMTTPQAVTVRKGRFRPHLDEAVSPDPATADILRGLLRATHGRGWRAWLGGVRQLVKGVRRKR